MNCKDSKTIPLWLAVLINVNVVIGGAFFINAPKISAFSGIISPILWLIFAVFFIPISIVFAKLASKFPCAGGIYVYSKEAMGIFPGFMTGWVYFVGAATGNAILLDALAEQLLSVEKISYFFGHFGIGKLGFSLILIAICMIFSIGGVKILRTAQMAFSWLKLIPFFVLAVACFFVGRVENLNSIQISQNWFMGTLPMIIFAYIGIETCCAMAHMIKDGFKNVAKATHYSLLLTAIFYSIAQFGLIFCLGKGSLSQNCFNKLALILSNKIGFVSPELISMFIFIAIAASYWDGAYTVFCSNNWNIFAIAQDLKGRGKKSFSRLNYFGEPINCIILQGVLMAAFLLISKNQLWMIQFSVISVTLAFLMTTFSYFLIFDAKKVFISGLLSLASISIITFFSTKELFEQGFLGLLPLIIILFTGILIYLFDRLFPIKKENLTD